MALGYLVGRIVISLVLLPAYFRGELFTAYELIQRRFGGVLRSVTAAMFLATRAAADGVRVFAVSIVVGIAIGTGDVASIAIILVLTLIYTFEGGITAVIWTDVLQLAIYIGGTLVGLYMIVTQVPGGWAAVVEAGATANKFRVFDLSTDLMKTYTFWAGLIGGSFLTMASHGTDQLIVQRLLAARGRREAQWSLVASGVGVGLQFALFLLVGVALYAFYQAFPPAQPFGRPDRIFPTFIVQEMPPGAAGLLLAAILAAAMSTMSSAMNSLSSSLIVDFYLRRKPQAEEQTRLRVSRSATLLWAAVLFVLALLSRRGGYLVEVGLSIASVAYGALLGVFLLGVLTKRANERGAVVGMACGFAVEMYVWLGTKVPWTWYVVIGTVVTFAVGYSASLAFRERKA